MDVPGPPCFHARVGDFLARDPDGWVFSIKFLGKCLHVSRNVVNKVRRHEYSQATSKECVRSERLKCWKIRNLNGVELLCDYCCVFGALLHSSSSCFTRFSISPPDCLFACFVWYWRDNWRLGNVTGYRGDVMSRTDDNVRITRAFCLCDDGTLRWPDIMTCCYTFHVLISINNGFCVSVMYNHQ